MNHSSNTNLMCALTAVALAGAVTCTDAAAQVDVGDPIIESASTPTVPLGTTFTYQARLTDGGIPYNGLANLEFRLYDAPAAGVLIGAPNILAGTSVDNGLFTVVLDFGAGAFGTDERWLEITVNGTPLAPRQLVQPGPVSHYALNVDGASIMNLHAPNITTGILPNARLSGTYSSPLTFSNAGNSYTGGFLNIDANGLVSNGGKVGVNKALSTWTVDVNSDNSAGLGLKVERGGGLARMAIGWTNGGVDQKYWGIDGGGTTLSFHGLADNAISILTTPMRLFRNGDAEVAGQLRLGPDIDMTGTAGGIANFRQSDDDPGVVINGNTGTVQTYGLDGQLNTRLYNGSWGELNLWDGSVTNDMTVTLSATSNSGGQLTLRDEDNSHTGIFLAGDNGTAGEISVFDVDGTETVEIKGAESSTQGAQILLRKADGTTSIEIDGDFNGDGRIITDELQINGGSDLSEQFDVAQPESGSIEPGMVVCIDPEHVGRLLISDTAYDRTVAGIISGAGGIETGMMMGQKGSIADGDYPIALTGRVYVWCDTSNGPIVPGDLLTTSDTFGQAMKVTDHARAQGAIIGKAMSRLEAGEGSGLVLVLVSLQ